MDITKILRNSELRKDLIRDANIKNFSNEEISQITSFINSSLKKEKNIEDLFELSLLLQYVTTSHIEIAKKVLKKRTSYYLKLTILDYLLTNFDKIAGNVFRHLSEIAKLNNNPFVSFQGRLNLVCLNDSEITFFIERENFLTPTFYYRLFNSISVSPILKDLFHSRIDIIEANISQDSINSEQKNELLQISKELLCDSIS